MCSACWLTCSTLLARPACGPVPNTRRQALADGDEKIAQLDASNLERVARYKSTTPGWMFTVSGPLRRLIRHLSNETQLTIGVAVVEHFQEQPQDETVVFDREQRPETGGRQPL